jgi:2,3-diketo-5-methylthio-1-phosphopentane phosphatase
MNKKSLIIFDFDKTILDKDSFGHIIFNTLTKDELQIIYDKRYDNWVDGYNYSLKQIKSHGISKNDFNKLLDELSLSKGMQDLFSYIKEQKEKYDIILISCNYDYVINYILNKYHISDIFSEIIANPSREPNPDENDQFIYVLKRKEHKCNNCNPCLCKNYSYKEFCETHNMNKYNKIISICDGRNDLCLAKELSKDDITFARKDFEFCKRLYKDNGMNNLKCKIEIWENGNDIVNYLKANKIC